MSDKDRLTVLVLGVGGNVSQGILKALALSQLKHRVIGACVSPLALGLYTVDSSYVSPLANDPDFLDWLLALCEREKVDAILSGVEPVLSALSAQAALIEEETGAVSIVSRPAQLAIGADKLSTCEWLKERGFNYPRFCASEDESGLSRLACECGYPLLAKPRRGKGGYGLIEIRNDRELEFMAERQDYVVEEWLGNPDEEYTAGCFCDRKGAIKGAIVMRRELQYGTSVRAEAGEYPEIRAEAVRIAEALGPMGPCNVQLRISNGRPVCFEINIRFSGTTPLRARLGFNEVSAALSHFVLGEPAPELPVITSGTVLRYWNEMYIDQAARSKLERTGRLDSPHSYELLVENYGAR